MDFGNMIDFLLSIDNFTLEEISRGICRKSYLSMCRSGEREMNAVVFYNIIRRLYLSPNRFNMMLSPKEYQYFKLLFEIYEAIGTGNYDYLRTIDLQEKENYFKTFGSVVSHDMNYFRFVYCNEVEKDTEKAYQYLVASIDYMKDSEGRLKEGRYGAEEINRFLNYIKTAIILKKISKGKAKKTLDQILSMLTLRKRDPREEARLYPRIICFVLLLTGELYSYNRWVYLLKEALERLINTSQCYDLPEVLRLLVAAESAEGSELTDRHQKWLKAVLAVYAEAGTDPTFNYYDSHDRNVEISLIHEYIRRSRLNMKDEKGRPISQKRLLHDLENDTVNIVNYSRIESGKSAPSRTNFEALTLELNVSGDYKRGEIVSSDISDYWLITDIRTAANKGDAVELESKLNILEEKLDMDFAENRQFIDQKKIILAVLKEEITEEESIERLIKVLEYTCPYEANINYLYNTVEEETIYMIVRNKRICGIMTKEDIDILKAYLENEESKKGSSWYRKSEIKRLLAGILQTEGENEEGARLAKECLTEMIEVHDFFFAKDCIDILAECIIEKDKEHAIELLITAYWLCDLCQDTSSMKAIETYLRDYTDISLN